MNSAYLIMLGTIFGALLASAFARASKISEFRQHWIDLLRERVATYLALSYELHRAWNGNEPSRERAAIQTDMNEQIHIVELMLNSQEEPHRELIALIKKLSEDAVGLAAPYEISRERIVDMTRMILKDEWNRVRKGEIFWKFSKLKRQE